MSISISLGDGYPAYLFRVNIYNDQLHDKCMQLIMYGLLTATIGNVEAMVVATSLSASFDDWSL